MIRETEDERWQRNFGDLLQELRVTQAGVQILFAFLLTIAFTAQFDKASTFQKSVYLVALLSSAAAASMFIAPVAYHRALFQRRRKPQLVRSAHRLASAGLALLLVAMVSSILLAVDALLARPVAIAVGAAAAVWFVVLWAVMPMRRRGDTSDPGDEVEPGGGAG